MRAAAILGPGCSSKNLQPFQNDKTIEWFIGMPTTATDADIILLFGGDGSIHRHLTQFVTLNLPVLVVPAGSGNDFARALGLRSVRDSLTAWRKFHREKNNVGAVDLGVIQPIAHAPQISPGNELLATRYFSSVAGIGLDAEVTRRANNLPRWLRGHGGYALSLVPALVRFAPLPMKISTRDEQDRKGFDSDGWTVRSDQPTMLAAFANTSSYGGGMKIAPQAKLDDGLLDVCVIGGVDPFKLVCMFPTVYFGRHLRIREVNYFQARSVRVETELPLDVYADGEFVCRTPIEVGIRSAALRVLMP
jgi:diacylglycerol kinase (ATP)